MKKVKDQNSNFKYEISDYFFKINFVTEITCRQYLKKNIKITYFFILFQIYTIHKLFLHNCFS